MPEPVYPPEFTAYVNLDLVLALVVCCSNGSPCRGAGTNPDLSRTFSE
jgi:hypothetical protein